MSVPALVGANPPEEQLPLLSTGRNKQIINITAVATWLTSNTRDVRVTWEERQTCSGWQPNNGGVDKREFPDSVNIRLTAAGHSL